MPKLPEKVRVGYRDFAVRPMKPLEATAKDIFGECDLTMAEISIRDDLHPVKAANTLLHEVLHAAFYIGNIDHHGPEQEKIVTVLANMLSQVWRDNPDFVAFIEEGINGAGADRRHNQKMDNGKNR